MNIMQLNPCIFLISFTLLYVNSSFMKNRYEIEFENIMICPENEKMVNPIRNLKFSKINRTHKTLSYDFVYDRPLDESVGWSVVLEKWSDGDWRRLPFIDLQPNLCKQASVIFGDTWVGFHRNVGIKHPEKCPLPAGRYSLKNYIMETAYINIPCVAGRFRSTVRYVDMATKKFLQCYIYLIKLNEIFHK